MAKYVKFLIKSILRAACHFTVILFTLPLAAQSDCMLQIPFESDSNYSSSYSEIRSFFHNAANCAEFADYQVFGDSDAGHPLSVIILDKNKKFQPRTEKDKRAVVLINNAIHAGEPCGVEASMLLVRDMVEKGMYSDLLDDVILLIVPVYNIGGAMNRNSHSRANQNGPKAYGFRGNAQNLDLNRDFVKGDSKNAKAMHKLFNRWNPDIFIDTHTSNGADYQYTMTLIANMKDRLAPSLRSLIYYEMLPEVYDSMAQDGWDMIPYVNVSSTPDDGIVAFNDLGRYSMGYGALLHIPSFTTEAHMFKPYADRVMSTHSYLKIMLEYTAKNKKSIRAARQEAIEYYQAQSKLPIAWELNKTKTKSLLFKGYEAGRKLSEVTGQERLYYDRNRPYEKEIPFYDHYDALITVNVPDLYVLPQAYSEVAEKLRLNGVKMERSRRDSMPASHSYRIVSYETRKSAYEGHYLHYDVEVQEEIMAYQIRHGDYIIRTDQPARRFIVETLEPQGPDSYFAWNFFDGILMQKEYFSPYVFEDEALLLLQSDAKLKSDFEEKKSADPAFAKNFHAQLDFIYKRSPHYESTHNLYPVGRIFDGM